MYNIKLSDVELGIKDLPYDWNLQDHKLLSYISSHNK